MKILFYLHNLWDISATTRLSVDLANYLSQNFGIQIDFAVNKRIKNDIKDLPFNLHVLNKKGEIGKALALKELIDNNNYDIVLAYMLTQNIILSISKMLSKRKNKTVFLGSVHNSDNYMENKEFYKIPYRFLMKKIYENLDGVIAVSSTVKDDINKAFFVNREKIKVIYNYIDVKKIRSLAKESLSPKEKEIFKNPVVINVGRVEVQKGQIYLIEAFKQIKEAVPQAKLVIIGDGSQRSTLENKIKKLKLEKDVFLFGYKKNPFKYIALSKVFAFPSLWEGVGNVVLEAQALGIPVVAFNSLGGHIDVLKDSGILVESKNVSILAKEILKLLINENLWEKYSLLSIENINKYTVEKKAKEYYQYFSEKLKEKLK